MQIRFLLLFVVTAACFHLINTNYEHSLRCEIFPIFFVLCFLCLCSVLSDFKLVSEPSSLRQILIGILCECPVGSLLRACWPACVWSRVECISSSCLSMWGCCAWRPRILCGVESCQLCSKGAANRLTATIGRRRTLKEKRCVGQITTVEILKVLLL